MTFEELFPEWRIFEPRDKICRDTVDYNLPPGWVFIVGMWVDGQWIAVYGDLGSSYTEVALPRMSNGIIAAVQLRKQLSGGFRAVATPHNGIGQYIFAEKVTEIPDFKEQYRARKEWPVERRTEDREDRTREQEGRGETVGGSQAGVSAR